MVKIDWELKLSFKDVLIRPKRTKLRSRKDVDLNRTYHFLHSKREWTGIPIISANMDTTGTFEMALTFANYKCIVAIHKHYTAEEWIEFAINNKDNDILNYVAISSGTSDKDFNKLRKVLNSEECNKLSLICLDVANGYSEHFVEYVRKVRCSFPKHTIMAGNVVTGEMTEQLILSGADIVKVGIGPGSVCTTRKKTGVGYPQLSAVLECADAAHGLGGLVVSDGGCTMPGDFSKAFGAGADFVMAGGMFSGHDESGGDVVIKNGKKYKQFYGMSSAVAMNKHSGGVANYRASEGKCVLVPYRGPVSGCLDTLLGGIRSTCTYVGASKLKELTKRTTFVRVQHHHNIVFGDEKNDNANSGGKQNTSAIKKNWPIYDPSLSVSDLTFKKKINIENGGEEEKDNNDIENENPNLKQKNINDIFDNMSQSMKEEYFEWLYQRQLKYGGNKIIPNGGSNVNDDNKNDDNTNNNNNAPTVDVD